MSENKMLQAALSYIARGWAVFPLYPKDKKPITKNGFKNASTDPEQVRSWWTNTPNANIGIATGGGIVVIDIDNDPEKGKDGSASLKQWEQANGALPPTLSVKTGRGGRHLYYKSAESFGCRTSAIPYVDIRGEGGYIVAPPSVHPNGNIYEWETDLNTDTLAEVSATVKKLIEWKEPRKRKNPPVGKLPLPGAIAENLNFSEGNRNDGLFRLAASLQARGAEDSEILSHIESVNERQCHPPLDTQEVQNIVRGVLERYPKGLPRNAQAFGSCEAAEEHLERLEEKFPFVITKINENTGEIKYTISPPRLKEHIRGKERYFFVDTNGEKPYCYWWNAKGVYERFSETKVRAIIKEYIAAFSADYVQTKILTEVYGLLLTDRDRMRRPEELNRAETLINFKNGLLNIDTLALSPHSPEVLSTIQIPYNWNPNASGAPVFDEYLKGLSGNDPATAKILLQYLGLVLSSIPGYKCKKALFLYGAGDTGKSRFIDLINCLLGAENCCAITLENLENNQFGASSLYNKRFAAEADASSMKMKELRLFKSLTGGDDIPIEFKGKDRFTWKFSGLLAFATNEPPLFGGDKGDHVYERMIVIPCENVVPKEKRDPDIVTKMATEAETILHIAVLALRELKALQFQFELPERIKAAVEVFRKRNDNVLRFLEERTEDRKPEIMYKDGCTAKAVYNDYCLWAREGGEYPLSAPAFRSALARHFKKKDATELERKIHGTRFYIFTLKKYETTDFMAFGAGKEAI